MRARSATAGEMPGLHWWLILATLLAVGIAANWFAALGLLVFVLLQMAWPLDFLVSFLIVVGGAAFVFNEGGNMTLQLAMLSGTITLMLACYLVATRKRAFGMWNSPLSWPVFTYLALSLANTARGLLVGNMRRNLGLELVAILALCSALLVANAIDPRRHLRPAMIGIVLIAIGPSIRALYIFSLASGHTSGVYSLAVPGIAALMLVNLALRAPTLLGSFGWSALSLPFFFEQFVSFGRGLWTGGIAGLLASVLIFAVRRRGSAPRWRRAGLVLAMMLGLGVFGTIQAALMLGKTDVLMEAGTRLTSIASTTTGKTGLESRSNVIRLVEYAAVAKLLLHSPVFGYGIGYTFPVKEVFSGKTADQWGVHENYLMVWLKQGLIGVAVFVWMLWTAIAVGVREARRRQDFWESSWFATTAAATILLAVFSLSNYPFAAVNETFLLALLWGGAIAMTGKEYLLLRWSPPRWDDPGEAA